MSIKRNCWDNAVAEPFFKSLKVEAIYPYRFTTRKKAKLVVFEYIETWYNKNRKHSTLGGLTIKEFEKYNHLKQVV
jgi:transposase InsO family protein